MFLKRQPDQVKAFGDQRLLDLLYQTKASWNQAKETAQAVYESNVSNELAERTKLQECKYLYLYERARRRGLHGQLNAGVIMR